ncbi:MAG: cytochrome c3 family protein [Planctomycetes bacterium]|nr:cytochrome c3 family protein [Planctomycetota bacterium]
MFKFLFTNLRSRIKFALIFGFAALILAGIAGFMFIEYTAQPSFCSTCHIMAPYVESWKHSKHNKVPCVDCHYEPGLMQTSEGKFKAFSQVAKYITGTEGTKPWAEISDNSCMREGCHSKRLLEGSVTFGKFNIRFNHTPHLTELRRNKSLKCTSCHSQIVQGEHLTVTRTTCFLCHFKEPEQLTDEEHANNCLICHGPPSKPIQLGNFTFNHSAYLDRGVQCQTCHSDITRGTGEVPKDRCGSCHGKVEHLEKYNDTPLIHRKHVTEHKVDCTQCHIEISHSLTKREELINNQGDCVSCHINLHNTEVQLYTGKGAKDVPDTPSAMFLARVSCNSCHIPYLKESHEHQDMQTHTFKATEIGCMNCHGTGFVNMKDNWQTHIKSLMEKIQPLVDRLDTQASEIEKDAGVAEVYHRLKHNFNLIINDGSIGVHNLPYSVAILQKSLDDANIVSSAISKEHEPLKIDFGSQVKTKYSCTSMCHLGIEKASVNYKNSVFNHTKHITSGSLDCDACHSTDEHGKTNLSAVSCHTCHEKEKATLICRDCHSRQYDMRAGRFDGMPEKQVGFMRENDCADCHSNIFIEHTPETIKAGCSNCHDTDVAGAVAEQLKDYAARLNAARLSLKQIKTGLHAADADKKRIYEEAEKMYVFASTANAVHNPSFAYDIINELEKKLALIK